MGTSLPSRSAPIIERAPLPVVEVEGSTHIVSYVNSAFCTLLGKSRADLLGKGFAEIIPRGDECLPLLTKVFETGEAVTHVLEDDSAADPAVWLYAMWPALDADERPVGLIIQMAKTPKSRHDVAAVNEALLIAGLRQHELNAQLQQMGRDKDEFLAMLSHELRNPLASIRMAAHVLGMVKSEDSTTIQMHEMIERQANHLARLVDDLLDVSRLQQGKVTLRKETVDLEQAISRAVAACEYLIQGQGHTIQLDLPRIPPLAVEADPTRIDQVLVNLIGNASKYTPKNGEIHVKASREHGVAVIRVRDSGIGIEPEMLGRVFDAFTQVTQSLDRSQGGLGLGLRVVKELVELHGGSVEATSEGTNRGSEFIVRLPLLEQASRSVAEDVPVVRGRAAARRILVVDDRRDNREAMEVFLTLSGHSVEVAEDGLMAVEMALQTHPDVAFVDIGLPKLNGYEVAKQIRQGPAGDRIVLVAISGYGQADVKHKALEAGFDAHLTKPVNPDAITELLNELDRFHRNS